MYCFVRLQNEAFRKGVKHMQKIKNLRRTVNMHLAKTILVSKKPSDNEIHNEFTILKKNKRCFVLLVLNKTKRG